VIEPVVIKDMKKNIEKENVANAMPLKLSFYDLALHR
jgi:hypothetical protein